MSKKVLIINDSRFERLILKDMLSELGYQVMTSDEYDYSQQIKNHSPHILIVNLTMGSVSGDDIILETKTANPEIKCYLSSCSPIKFSNYINKKVDGVFQTPINSKELALVLSNDIPKGFCPYCGKELINELACFRFCPFCGEKFAETSP